jgi:hypothetical protein
MDRKFRIPVLSLTLALSLIAVSSIQPAQAFFTDSFDNMVESMLNSMQKVVLSLSDDIGTMADRILVMADNILIMADKIGEMSDRIVTTEQLMADLVRDLNNSRGPSTLITLPTEGTNVSLSASINITLSNNYKNYVLLMANTADMSHATNVLVLDGDTSNAWRRAADYATGERLYIAVKAIQNNIMGPISNTVMIRISP